MYGYLNFDIKNPLTPWIAHYFALPDVADTLPPKQEGARKIGVEYLVKSNCPELTDANRKLLCDEVYNVIRLLPANMLQISFELYMALAHCRLDAGMRAAREQRIASIMNAYLPEHPIESVRQRVKGLQALAVLVPDAAMNVVLRSRVVLTNRSILTVPYGQAVFKRSIHLFDEICREFGWKDPRFQEALQACHFSRLPSDQAVCLDLIEQARSADLNKLLPLLLDRLAACEQYLFEADLGDAVYGLLQGWMALAQPQRDGSAMEDLVAIEVERFVTQRTTRCSDICSATLDAINRKVPFDPASMAANTAAIVACTVIQAEIDLALSGTRLRKELSQDKPTPTPVQAPEAPKPDTDAMHARSVEWLVDWIEGPAASTQAPVRLNRQAIAKAESEGLRRARTTTKRSAPAEHNDEDMTEKDVGLVLDSGLSTYASYVLGDISSLLSRSRSLKLQPELLAVCEGLIKPLQDLAQRHHTDELQAQGLLHRANAAIAAVEQDIAATTRAEKPERVHQHFERALYEALNREPLVYGKGHGGVIDCAMREADWSWVHQSFHQRWINAQRLEIDGRLTALRADRAVAMYVTGSSHSGYAFDISVHLWCRKSGCTGSPCMEGGGLYPRMNTRTWHDSRITCLVLHVPSKN